PQTSRGRDRLLQRAAYLEPEAPASSSCALRHPIRRAGVRSHPLDSIPPSLLPPPPGTPPCVSRQVRCRAQVSVSAWPATSFRQSGSTRSTQDLRFLAPATISKRLDRVLQTTLRWP